MQGHRKEHPYMLIQNCCVYMLNQNRRVYLLNQNRCVSSHSPHPKRMILYGQPESCPEYPLGRHPLHMVNVCGLTIDTGSKNEPSNPMQRLVSAVVMHPLDRDHVLNGDAGCNSRSLCRMGPCIVVRAVQRFLEVRC